MTVIVKLCEVAIPKLSVAVNTTLFEPTFAFVGVPERTPLLALKESQEGSVVACNVSVWPGSTSVAVKVYEYALSSVADVTAVELITGALPTLPVPPETHLPLLSNSCI